MRISSRKEMPSAEADLTPMIDMTFQLIAFFMILINFNDQEQNAKIKLPRSQIVKPPEEPLENPIVIHLTAKGKAIFRGHEVDIPDVEKLLLRHKGVFPNALDSTVIIRDHENAETGKVQELISACQHQGFDKFALRAKQEDPRKASAG